MKIKKGIVIVGALLLFGMLVGCQKGEENLKTRYAIVTKSAGNAYNERIVAGFREVIEAGGNTCIVRQPEVATAEAQLTLIERLIAEGVEGMAVAANDASALEETLTEARKKGIKVVTLDSDTKASARTTFINQVSAQDMGQTLMEAVYDICGGEGQWAILSTTSQATNQNEWIEGMKLELEKPKYKNLRLVDIAYGGDKYDTSMECAKKLLADYPDLKVICAPTSIGIHATCEVLAKQKKYGTKVTGLGLPSEMAEYIGEGNTRPCPYMYLWNPKKLGSAAAYTLLEMESGTITGKLGDKFEAGDLGTLELVECGSGGTQIIVGKPLRFDMHNILIWKDLF